MKLSNSLMCAAAIALAGCNGTQKEFNLTSPDGEIVVNVNVEDRKSVV